MSNRQQHQQEVRAFLQKQISPHDWKFSLPHGWGKESYFVEGNSQRYFVKVGVQVERYRVMAEIGLTPPVVVHGELEDGVSVIVQAYVTGQEPSRRDFRERLTDVAGIIRTMHNHPHLQGCLPRVPSSLHKDACLRSLDRLRQKWERHKAQVPDAAGFVENSLEQLAQQAGQFSAEGLVASHGDICNANWLFATDGRIYLVDFDLMSLDDPALDMGALLWWYYPPELRCSLLDVAGYCFDEHFQTRMRARMAMHCLDILLPRDGSFDQLHPEDFGDSLQDFRAVLNGGENPQGYND